MPTTGSFARAGGTSSLGNAAVGGVGAAGGRGCAGAAGGGTGCAGTGCGAGGDGAGAVVEWCTWTTGAIDTVGVAEGCASACPTSAGAEPAALALPALACWPGMALLSTTVAG